MQDQKPCIGKISDLAEQRRIAEIALCDIQLVVLQSCTELYEFVRYSPSALSIALQGSQESQTDDDFS